ncbi:MAG TPA: hypothetical protein VK724_28080 [Bryobacteraceae bacterium]|jgi:hypothetical protein|nr:hypothetical protein [Bryobacteraceae bacterium]
MKERKELSGTVPSVKFTNLYGSLAARDGSTPGFLKTVIMPDGA